MTRGNQHTHRQTDRQTGRERERETYSMWSASEQLWLHNAKRYDRSTFLWTQACVDSWVVNSTQRCVPLWCDLQL